MTITTNSESVQDFSNQPLKRLAGVYFENLGELSIFRDHWKFINYVNLKPLEDKENVLRFYMFKIKTLCYSKFKFDIVCSGWQELERIQRKLVTLKTERETINDMIGRFNDENHPDYSGARSTWCIRLCRTNL